MKEIRDRVAGLDVHRDTVVACARVVEGRRVHTSKETFGTTVGEVGRLARWLADFEVTTAAMEATGVYWKPVYYGLEGLIDELWLCNAQHVKNVPGRKTDLADAEWLADVVAHGMVRPSMVLPPAGRALRELTRYRKTQIDMRASEVQRLEKLLQDAGVKISSVASKVLGVGTRRMIEAMIAGERDPDVLAKMALSTMRSKIPRLREALPGRFSEHHARLARRILDHIDHLDASIAALDEEVVAAIDPFDEQVRLLCTIPGVSRRSAEIILAETGGDMSRFPSAGHLASWSGLAPGSNESAGKHRPAGTRKGGTWLRRTLIEDARAAARTRNTFFAARYHRLAARRGPNKASIAIARNIIEAAWHVLSTGQDFHDLGGDYYRRRNPEREQRRHVAALQALGLTVSIAPTT